LISSPEQCIAHLGKQLAQIPDACSASIALCTIARLHTFSGILDLLMGKAKHPAILLDTVAVMLRSAQPEVSSGTDIFS